MAHKIIAEECIACAACEPECPDGCISESEDGEYYVIDAGCCTDCHSCAEVCPVDCIEGEKA